MNMIRLNNLGEPDQLLKTRIRIITRFSHEHGKRQEKKDKTFLYFILLFKNHSVLHIRKLSD